MNKIKFKKKLWVKFSEFIRLKECLETTGTLTHGVCVTCGKTYPYKELQAGHFIDGRGNSVLFVEDIVHIQCLQCNFYKSGNKDTYTPYMIRRYGIEKVEQMLLLKFRTKSLSEFELIALYQDTCENIKRLKNN